MEADKFTSEKTGELVRIDTPDGHDWAFVPNALPPDWKLSHELLGHLGGLMGLYGIAVTLFQAFQFID